MNNSEPVEVRLARLEERFVRFDDKLGSMDEKLDKYLSELHRDHESRIRGLESAKNKLLGIASALGAAAGAVMSKLMGNGK